LYKIHIYVEIKIAHIHKSRGTSIFDRTCAINEYVLILTKIIINVHSNVTVRKETFSNEKRSKKIFNAGQNWLHAW